MIKTDPHLPICTQTSKFTSSSLRKRGKECILLVHGLYAGAGIFHHGCHLHRFIQHVDCFSHISRQVSQPMLDYIDTITVLTANSIYAALTVKLMFIKARLTSKHVFALRRAFASKAMKKLSREEATRQLSHQVDTRTIYVKGFNQEPAIAKYKELQRLIQQLEANFDETLAEKYEDVSREYHVLSA
ncbi:hypothetical protein VTP01DRAFT_6733 [Rhizomucor pusillus]|uniref:uncharacterized protein n=1 Tax=Rhizomucor pusillus TaxID=4840 RepID=UPI0037420833